MPVLPYSVVDVFTETRFAGNPLAVVLDADALRWDQMQAVAREFGFSETAFVLCPRDPDHDAAVRIFTPTIEVPFAGHPNIGAAFVVARRAIERPLWIGVGVRRRSAHYGVEIAVECGVPSSCLYTP